MNATSPFDQFKKKTALIIGDSMLDAYYFGNVERISPEAPVPIVGLYKKEYRLGGAANVALNVQALGAQPILCSVIGSDQDGDILMERMALQGLSTDAMIVDKDRPTTVKTRIIGNRNQMIRLDEESTDPIPADVQNALLECIQAHLDYVDVVIFQDYNKGVLTKALIEEVLQGCHERGVPTVVDPKFDHFFDYKNVSLFKPNKKEIAQAYNIARFDSQEQVIELAQQLRSDIGAERVLITLSEDGAALIHATGSIHQPAYKRKIVDVSGAGDSALSAAALTLACGSSDEDICQLANLAGGLVCEHNGVVPIDLTELRKELVK